MDPKNKSWDDGLGRRELYLKIPVIPQPSHTRHYRIYSGNPWCREDSYVGCVGGLGDISFFASFRHNYDNGLICVFRDYLDSVCPD